MTISYHASFIGIAYIIRLTLLDLFKVKWSNSHTFYEKCGFQGHRYTNMKAWMKITNKRDEETNCPPTFGAK